VLTVGATIPKFALHPRAHEMRRKIARIADEPSIAWAEYRSRDDTISFYKFDPVALRRIADDRLDGKPAQSVELTGDEDRPLTMGIVRLVRPG
jgi:hypothetical protein